MKQKIFYQVKVIQEMFWDKSKREYVAGTFSAEDCAKTFKKALEREIAEGCGYATNYLTPRVSIVRIRRTEEVLEA